MTNKTLFFKLYKLQSIFSIEFFNQHIRNQNPKCAYPGVTQTRPQTWPGFQTLVDLACLLRLCKPHSLLYANLLCLKGKMKKHNNTAPTGEKNPSRFNTNNNKHVNKGT